MAQLFIEAKLNRTPRDSTCVFLYVISHAGCLKLIDMFVISQFMGVISQFLGGAGPVLF